MDIHSALAVVKNPNGDMTAYRAALEFLVDHRGDLKQNVYIVLPGGLCGNSDPAWQKIKAGSDERCSCGNERVIVALNPREKFLTRNQTVLISPTTPAYLRPIGGDRESCYMKVEIEEGALTFLNAPFAPIVLTADLFVRTGYPLAKLAMVVDQKPTLFTGKQNTPLFQIVAVDQTAGSLTIDLDQDVETFDPDKEKPRHQ